MKEINKEEVIRRVRDAFIEVCSNVDCKTLSILKKCQRNEKDQRAKSILEQIIENDEIAAKENIPLCQDTGVSIIFAEIGNRISIPFSLEEAINEGVRQAYTEGYLRKSVVSHPLIRKNTGDNTPAIIHYNFVEGEELTLAIAPKGAGSENMSAIRMLNPSEGEKGVIDFVIETVKKAGGRPCPPIIVGVGVGGDFEQCALEAKKAVLREIDDQASDEKAKELESTLLNKINDLNIGPMGLGGQTTCLSVKVNVRPCHIASLPVAVNIQCHASRHKKIVL